MDLGKCHQIIRGMRLLIIEKDDEIRRLNKGVNRIVPGNFTKEMDQLRDETQKLREQNKDLLDQKKYMERVQREQGKALKQTNKESNHATLKAQEDEIRQIKRKKFEL